MYLHRIHLNLRSREARRDVADAYEMHSTLCRAFTKPDVKCLPGAFLWRQEPERNAEGMPRVIVQSRDLPDWSGIGLSDWFWEKPSAPLALEQTQALKGMKIGSRFRYRLRANPSICRNGKRLGLFDPEAQIVWLHQKGEKNGFKAITIHRSEDKMLIGSIRSGHPIRVYSVLYDGIIDVTDTQMFNKALNEGIGHAKAMGLGLISVAPVH